MKIVLDRNYIGNNLFNELENKYTNFCLIETELWNYIRFNHDSIIDPIANLIVSVLRSPI